SAERSALSRCGDGPDPAPHPNRSGPARPGPSGLLGTGKSRAPLCQCAAGIRGVAPAGESSAAVTAPIAPPTAARAEGFPALDRRQARRRCVPAMNRPAYPRLRMETLGQPDHLGPILEGLTTLVVVEFVFFHGLVAACISVESAIDGRGRTGLV